MGAERRRSTVSARAIAILVAVALVVFVLDQIAKALVTARLTEGVPVPVLGPLLTLIYVRNPGAAFSIGSGSTWIFSIIATAVLVFIVWYARRIRSAGWAVVFGLLLGGLVGNLTDRLTRPPGFGVGEVVDFLRIPVLQAIFNLADVGIVSAMVLFLILTLRGVGLDGSRPADRRPDPVSDAEADQGDVSDHGGDASGTPVSDDRRTDRA